MRAGRSVLGLLPRSVATPIRARLRTWLAPREQRRLHKAFAAIGATGIESPDINHLLHFLRGKALEQLPQGAGHFVSVGCAGTWYFDWINEKCAPRRHTGIEFYTPKPDDLPANAHWVANTAGNMEAVADATADILFSGQNIEHLWPHDVANFLLESHRVLKPGGLLVVDSPNRRMTAKLNWSHPEHTIEFDAAEAHELLVLAGFDVTRAIGLWLCETDIGGVLPFAEMTLDGAWPLPRRVAEAATKLDGSFIWWFEARRADRAPDEGALRRRIGEIHAVAWPERLNRLLTSIGVPVERNGETWFDSKGRAGALTFGPYTALPPGRHELVMTVEYPDGVASGSPLAAVQVSGGADHAVLVRREVAAAPAGQPIEVRLPFELADTTFQIQFVVVSPAGTRTLARKAVALHSSP
jgi:SAM-dependent methyltransferase